MMRQNENVAFKDSIWTLAIMVISLNAVLWGSSLVVPHVGQFRESIANVTPLLAVVFVVIDLVATYILLRLYRGA